MPVDLAQLVAPEHTAVLSMELQRGVVGDVAKILPALGEAVRESGVLDRAGALAAAARKAGVRVVHCTAEFRPDGVGTTYNCRLLAMNKGRETNMTPGSPGVQPVPEVGLEPNDVVVPRSHGIEPFVGTELDSVLRSLDVRTIVAMGVSLNVAIMGIAIVGVGLGYQVVVPTDAVVGVPQEYGKAILDNSLGLLATLTTVDELAAIWS